MASTSRGGLGERGLGVTAAVKSHERKPAGECGCHAVEVRAGRQLRQRVGRFQGALGLVARCVGKGERGRAKARSPSV